MSQNKMNKTYDFQKFEDEIYAKWEKSGYFNPDNLPNASDREPFSISMPPPNATGLLHIGHALFLTIQDIVIRYERMKGKKALWLPGTDHAAIATNAKVEQQLKKEGKTKYDLGQEKFIKRVQEYIANSQDTIRKQIRKMGASCDWSRERYTMDEGLTGAVQTAFINMYEDDLIYQGHRIVNWCPRCESTLADDEVEHKDQKAKLYYLKYGPFIIATSRPETKLGDTGVAVFPNDKRYRKFVGKIFNVDLAGHKITVKVIADQKIDPEFGSGALGVTPAHSQVDFEMAKKNNLEKIQVINEKGMMTEKAGKYAGLKNLKAREKFVKDLEKAGQIEKIEDYTQATSICYRCSNTVEPLISKQWFVAVDKKTKKLGGMSLKEKAIEVAKNNEIKFVPERFKNVYRKWMEELHDWCISRQIWFGHRMPVWYKKEDVKKEKPIISHEPPGKDYIQETDTLDTWFSASLWTFSTLGWPDKTEDLKTYHPTSLMETGYDIIFFWVARMILMSTYQMKEIPFKKVYLHGLVRDRQGRKMSKSLGNGIDPIEMIEKYGADAVRLSLVIGISPGNDSKSYEEKIKGYRNFSTKLWNIGRFCKERGVKLENKIPEIKSSADAWIIGKLSKTIESYFSQMEKYNFGQVGDQLYNFTWHDFADWYLEASKKQEEKNTTNKMLGFVLKQLLVILHPYTPFVTEKIWQEFGKEDHLLVKLFPTKEETVAVAKLSKKHENEAKRFEKQKEKIEKERKQADFKKNKTKYEKQLQEIEKYIKNLEKKLKNKAFIKNAPKEVVERERRKLEDFRKKQAELEALLG